MNASGPSLRELFSSAKGKQGELDDGVAGRQEILQSAISAFEECRNLISKLAIFSPNEEVEDVSTQNLQYYMSALCPSPSEIDTSTDI
jgi:hypothetical protein